MALTEQKRRYAEARLSGLPKKKAAIEAGCPEKTASQAAARYEKDPDVMAAMGRQIVAERVKQDTPNADPDPYIPAQADDPAVYLAQVMNDLAADPKMRLDAAKALMPYKHQKLGEGGKKDAKKDAAEQAGKGKFAAAPPPGQLRRVK